MKICVVGAGLVGSLWAILLKQRGYDVILYEKRHDPRGTRAEQGRSINLVITSRGLNALKQAELLKEVVGITIPVFGRMIHSKSGETAYQPYGREDECNYCISRGSLNNFLLTVAEKRGVKIHFGHQLQSIDFRAKKLIFSPADRDASSREAKYDLLFGADGAGSVVRRLMMAHLQTPNLERVDWLDADYKELIMPADAGGNHVLQKNALHIWPRGSHMLMALANGDGTFTMTLYLPKRGAISFEKIKERTDVEKLFTTEFPDAVPLLADYASEFEQNPQGALGTVRCQKWLTENSATLIGDAAHAIIPFFGQGMNCGFEDCTTLLALLKATKGDWSQTLQNYDEHRRIDTNAIADMAIENWVEMRDRVGDAQFLMRKKVESWLEKEFPDLYKSRYGMITYTLIPYSLAQKAGKVQSEILDVLCKNITTPTQINKANARALLENKLQRFLRENNIDLRNQSG